MKYTFTDDQGRSRMVVIPDEYIYTQKKTLGLSNKEAILLYLSDEGIIKNPAVEELTAKAKANGVSGATKSRKAPKRKEDPIKREIIASLFDYIQNNFKGFSNMVVCNPERIISFSLGDDTYELTLSKKRKK